MTPPVELVIFDCDGVLVDSERLSIRIDAVVLASLGWPLSAAEESERIAPPARYDPKIEYVDDDHLANIARLRGLELPRPQRAREEAIVMA